MQGEPVGKIKAHDTVLPTFSMLGGWNWRGRAWQMMRPRLVQVNDNGSLQVQREPSTIQRAYESTTISGTPYVALLNNAPVQALDISNDGSAAITLQVSSKLNKAGTAGDYTNQDARTIDAGEYRVLEGAWVEITIATASGSAQAFRVATYT